LQKIIEKHCPILFRNKLPRAIVPPVLAKRYAAFPVKKAGLNAQSKTKQGGTCVNCSSDTFPESSAFIAEEE